MAQNLVVFHVAEDFWDVGGQELTWRQSYHHLPNREMARSQAAPARRRIGLASSFRVWCRRTIAQ
jgi:hypothetical protein